MSHRIPIRSRLASLFVVALIAGLIPAGTAARAQADDPASTGRFVALFSETTIYDDGDINAPRSEDASDPSTHCLPDNGGDGDDTLAPDCKPAAVTMTLMGDNRLLYFNGLENTEYFSTDQEGAINVVAQGGAMTVNDQTRVLDLTQSPGGFGYDDPVFTFPANNRAETRDERHDRPLIPGQVGPLDTSDISDLVTDADTTGFNDEALFCADVNLLPDGRVIAVGGTNYYTEPEIPGTGVGVIELEGTTQSRVYDPDTNAWTELAVMNYGRWYPSIVTLPDGNQLVASGVTKLIKPVYTDDLEHPEDSGRNVPQTETLILDDGEPRWEANGESGEKSLPLFPRLHLLPNGDVFFNAAGQVYNPQGQAYDEALWNQAATYDPDTRTWTDLGIPGLTAGELSPTPGFRGSASSIMLPLRPDAAGAYTTAEFLSAGGTTLVTPGSYFAIDTSYITTVDTSTGTPVLGGRTTGNLNAPRWYGAGVGLPTGEVLLFNGADRDEVVNPGTGTPVTVPELFDPATETWTTLADQGDGRTYHNMAMLMPDGRVMVSGHSPIPDGYALNGAYPGDEDYNLYGTNPLGFSDDGRNSSFQIFEPPYLFNPDGSPADRPQIRNVNRRDVQPGEQLNIVLAPGDAQQISSAVLVRKGSITHLVDADQRTVVLDNLRVTGASIQVDIPSSDAVVPPGEYMLFVNAGSSTTGGTDLVPSQSVSITVA